MHPDRAGPLLAPVGHPDPHFPTPSALSSPRLVGQSPGHTQPGRHLTPAGSPATAGSATVARPYAGPARSGESSRCRRRTGEQIDAAGVVPLRALAAEQVPAGLRASGHGHGRDPARLAGTHVCRGQGDGHRHRPGGAGGRVLVVSKVAPPSRWMGGVPPLSLPSRE
ncbi:hypothetical protein STAN_4157 [Streptomyces sp. CBMAI 2042]|nr:hypothetical protein STAN_4157 [Streptomyces sp. CBMAI 2042]